MTIDADAQDASPVTLAAARAEFDADVTYLDTATFGLPPWRSWAALQHAISAVRCDCGRAAEPPSWCVQNWAIGAPPAVSRQGALMPDSGWPEWRRRGLSSLPVMPLLPIVIISIIRWHG